MVFLSGQIGQALGDGPSVNEYLSGLTRFPLPASEKSQTVWAYAVMIVSTVGFIRASSLIGTSHIQYIEYNMLDKVDIW